MDRLEEAGLERFGHLRKEPAIVREQNRLELDIAQLTRSRDQSEEEGLRMLLWRDPDLLPTPYVGVV